MEVVVMLLTNEEEVQEDEVVDQQLPLQSIQEIRKR